jgi:dTDP-4-dehydrorhamnose 3,5-epimerase-like enzyme
MNRLSGVETILQSHINDKRDSLLKIMHGAEPGLPDNMGEIDLVRGYPGQSRANHWHEVATEWFTLISDTAALEPIDVETAASMTFTLNAVDPVTVKVPPMVAHSFVNNGNEDFVLIAYTDERCAPADIRVSGRCLTLSAGQWRGPGAQAPIGVEPQSSNRRRDTRRWKLD